MSWFALDDGFDTHPKVRRIGNAAAGLFVRLGAYAARHKTDGHIPGPVARDYSTAAQLRKLDEVGMLHRDGHGCAYCPQPEPGGYVIHDYLEYNRSRAQIDERKAAATGRKRRQRTSPETRPAPEPKPDQTPEPPPAAPPTGPQTEPRFSDGGAGQDEESRRDPHAWAHAGASPPIPSPPLSPTEIELASPDGSRGALDGPRIAEPVRPLVEAMTAAGVVVGWDLAPVDWVLLQVLVERCTVPVLVEHARGAWHSARQRPRSARYFLPGWRSLPSVPAGTPTAPGPGADVIPLHSARPSTTDQRVRDGLDLAARLREQEQAQ